MLQLSLPSAYPSEQPPEVHLSAAWLSLQQLQQLSQHLLSMWDDASGFPICYTWVDWLQQDGLAHLGITDTLDLSQFMSSPAADNISQSQEPAGNPQSSNQSQEAAGQSPSSSQVCCQSEHGHHHTHQHPSHDSCQSPGPEEVLMTLMRFNAAEKLHAFQDGTWSCGICFEQFPGRACVQASPQCGHVYCRGCMSQYCGLHVREGSLEFLRCPQPDCKEAFDRQVSC